MAEPFDKSILVDVFVLVANQQANPKDFLLSIVMGNFTAITDPDNGATVLTSQQTGGSSANWTVPVNLSRGNILELAMLAIRLINTGIDAAQQYDANGNPVPRQINQVDPSKRLVSYPIFGNIQR